MPYTIEDFRREVALENLDQLTPEERLNGLSEEEIRAYLAKLQERSSEAKRKRPKRRRNRRNPDG